MIIKHNKLIVDLLDSMVILFMLIVTILSSGAIRGRLSIFCLSWVASEHWEERIHLELNSDFVWTSGSCLLIAWFLCLSCHYLRFLLVMYLFGTDGWSSKAVEMIQCCQISVGELHDDETKSCSQRRDDTTSRQQEPSPCYREPSSWITRDNDM